MGLLTTIISRNSNQFDTRGQFLMQGFPGGSDGKGSYLQCRRAGFEPWGGKTPWRRKWQRIAVFLQRNLVGCSPWGLKESNVTNTHFLSHARLFAKFFVNSAKSCQPP